MSRNYDNWEKLVRAVLRKEKDRQLAYCESLDSSSSSDFGSGFSFEISFAGDFHQPASVSRSSGQKIDHSDLSSSNIFFSGNVRATQHEETIRKASKNVGVDNVYKACIDEQSLTAVKPGFGIVVAVEMMKESGDLKHQKKLWMGYFEDLQTDIRSEVELVTKFEHRNIIKLLGYFENGNKRLIVTEYVPNGTLREHLDCKVFELTTKSDVYSFGILLLEILTGRRPVDMKRPPDERVTIRWAFRKYKEGRFSEMVDPLIEESVDKEILVKMFSLAFQCAAPRRADRPDMKAVGEQLWGIRRDYLKSEMKE